MTCSKHGCSMEHDEDGWYCPRCDEELNEGQLAGDEESEWGVDDNG